MAKKRSKRTKARADAAPPAWHGWWDGLSGGAQHAVCLAVLLAVSLGFWAPIHFGGGAVVGPDTVKWREMAASMIDYREATGEEPLWSTNAFAGMPGYTINYPNAVPQLDTVATLLRRVVWPTSHFLFLLVGAYLLVWFLTREKLAGVLAACGYGLTTYLPIIFVVGHNSKFIALCFAPWLLLAFAFALRRPGLVAGLLFAAALALNLRAGHIQITYYVAFLLGVWWTVELVGALRHGRAVPFGKATGWLALGSVLGVLMVAQPYLVMQEYKVLTQRGAAAGGAPGSMAWDYAMQWSQGPAELVTLLIADAFGGGGGTYWGPKPPTAGPHYVGGVVVLLAVLGLVGAGRALGREARPHPLRNVALGLGIGTFVMMLFALGRHFEAFNRVVYAYVPLFDSFRVPETWLSVVALALAGLAALGVWFATRTEPAPAEAADRSRAVYAVTGAVAGFVLVLFLGSGAFFSFEKEGERAQVAQQIAQGNNVPADDPRVIQAVSQYLAEVQEERADRFSGDATRTLLFVLLAGGLLILHRRRTIPAWAMQAGLALLVVVDLWGVGRRYFNEEALQPSGAIEVAIEAQIPTYDFDQFILAEQARAGGPGAFRVLSLEGGQYPFTNARPSYLYESLGGYSAAKLRLYQDYIDTILPEQPNSLLPNETALDLLNARYLIAPVAIPGYELVFTSGSGAVPGQGVQGHVVLENTDAVPRAFFVSEVEAYTEPEEAWQRLRDPGFDPRQTALVRAGSGLTTTPIDSASTARVDLEAYGPNVIAFRVETDAPRLLVVSEVFYPAGWTAMVDGEPAEIHQVDYLLRGVEVPAGAHEVVMTFEPFTHTAGVWVSAASTVLVYGGLAVLLGLAFVRRRRGELGGAEPEDVPAA